MYTINIKENNSFTKINSPATIHYVANPYYCIIRIEKMPIIAELKIQLAISPQVRKTATVLFRLLASDIDAFGLIIIRHFQFVVMGFF